MSFRPATFLPLIFLLLVSAAAPQEESFNAILTGGMAPWTLHVNAVDIRLAHGNWLTARYEWDFGDTTPTSCYNELTGWNAAHTYDRPGSYPVTLTVTDEAGEKRIFKKNFIINPDRRRIIYVSNHGNDMYQGDSPEQPVRTLSRVARMLKDNTKVLLRRGDTFDLPGTIQIKHENILFGAYDDRTRSRPATAAQSAAPGRVPAPTNPIIKFTGALKYIPMFETKDTTSDITFENLTFDSRFNTGTEKVGMPDCIKPAGANTTVRNCTFLNVGYGINCNQHPRGVMVQDNTCPLETGLRSYFVWVQGSDFAILGNTVANSTREHCMRVGGGDRLLIAYNTFSNLDRRPADKLDTNKGAMTIHAGSYVYVTHNLVLHGELLLGPLGKEDGKKNPKSRWNWAVIEDNGVNTFIYINHGTNHLLIRDNYVRRNDWACIVVEGYDTEYQRGNSDVWVENNTGVNKSTRGNFLRVTGPVDGITVKNNVYIAPKLSLKDNFSAPVFVDDKSLASFKLIENNIWPDLKQFQGVNYVKGEGGYLPEDKWLAEPQVKGDRFETLPLPTTQPATGESEETINHR